jgi:hypothetical protein
MKVVYVLCMREIVRKRKAIEVNFFQSTNEGRALVSKLRGICYHL